MSKHRIFQTVLLVFIVASFTFVVACGDSNGSSGGGSVSGKVSSDSDGSMARLSAISTQSVFLSLFVSEAQAQVVETTVPLEGATVNLINVDGNIVATTTTDEAGEFLFVNVEAGTYSIEVVDPRIDTLVVVNVVVLEGDNVAIEGTVTTDGTEVFVSYQIEDCADVESNDAQLTHATQIAAAAEVSVDEVIAVRENGCVGWGVVAQNFGVHPSVLGVGNVEVHSGGKPENPGNSSNAASNANNGQGRPENPGNSENAPGHA